MTVTTYNEAFPLGANAPKPLVRKWAKAVEKAAGAFAAAGDGVSNDAPALAAAVATGPVRIPPNPLWTFNPTEAEALSILKNLKNAEFLGLTGIQMPAMHATVADGNIANLGDGSRLLSLFGATPLITTLTGVAGPITGAPGNWSVPLTLTSAAGLTVGDYLMLYEVTPLTHLSGDNSVERARPVAGEMANTHANLGNITVALGSTAFTLDRVDNGPLSNYLAVGDLITVGGQTRIIATVGAMGGTVTTAWSIARTVEHNWYYAPPAAGTIGTGGAPSQTVTGVGTSFLTTANIGDKLLVNGAQYAITAIASDTSLTISHAANIPAGSKCAILISAVLHEGAHEITAIAGNVVTVRNASRRVAPPPRYGVTGGQVTGVRTIIEMTGDGDGLFFDQGGKLGWINNILFVGNRTNPDSHGIALNGRAPEGPTQIGNVADVNLGNGVAFVGWGRSALVGHNCTLQARKAMFGEALHISVWLMEGAVAKLREVVIHSGLSYGLAVNADALALITEARFIGNGWNGATTFDNGILYGEIPIAFGNLGFGFYSDGGYLRINGAVADLNALSGTYLTGGGLLRFQNGMAACNGREAAEISSSAFALLSGAWLSGTSGTTGSGLGILARNINIEAANCAITGNKGNPVYIDGGLANLEGATLAENIGLYVDGRNGTSVNLRNAVVSGVAAQTRVFIDITGVSPAPLLSGVARVNERAADGSFVLSGVPSSYGVAPIRIDGGAQLGKVLTEAPFAYTFTSVPAGGELSVQRSLAGLTTSGWVPILQVNSYTAGISYTINITSADNYRLTCRNATGAAVSPASTFTVAFLKVSV